MFSLSLMHQQIGLISIENVNCKAYAIPISWQLVDYFDEEAEETSHFSSYSSYSSTDRS